MTGTETARDGAPTAAVRRFALGDFRGVVVSDGPLQFPASITAPSVLPGRLAQGLGEAGLDPDAPVTYAQNVLVIDAAGHLVLVDAGTGGSVPGTGLLRAGLRDAGIDPGDVGTVVLTHAHFDHIGGLVDADGAPAFPRARYVISRPEWAYWSADPPLAELAVDDAFREPLRAVPRAVLPAVRDVLDVVDFGAEPVPGVTLVEAVGHTPGHTMVEVASKGERLVHVGDAITLPLQLRHTDWVGPVDNWPAHTVPTRRRLLDRAADERLLVFASHFPFPGLGRVGRSEGEGNWRWEPVP